MLLLRRRNPPLFQRRDSGAGIAIQGRVLVGDGQSFTEVGRNRVTKTGKLAILRILAMTGAHAARSGVDFVNDEGVSLPVSPADTTLTPRKLVLGAGTRASSADDTTMQSPFSDVFPLARVDVRDSVLAYGTDPVTIAWEFDIPVGPINEPANSGDLMINEWGLLAGDGVTLLARSQSPFLKNVSGSFVTRWEWWIA